jgi:ubiquinone/menaquinone biosynthesis C-methylase UbiE
MSASKYLLSSRAEELERLRVQARVWEPDAEAMLDQIGLRPGMRCIDVGCGAMGILGPLSRRVGRKGKVIGLDMGKMVEAARAYVAEHKLTNVEIVEQDAYDTGLKRGSFDLVHERLVMAPVSGRSEALLQEMCALAKPGGIIATQEPDTHSQNCHPERPAWHRLQELQRAVFAHSGADANQGQHSFAMLRRAGLEDVQVRAGVVALRSGHPYVRLPILFAIELRQKILKAKLAKAAELDALIKECEAIARDPDSFFTTLVMVQVWGRKPA